MWATFPMLREALQLIDARGFAYKQAFVWDKGHGSLGHYHDCDAELLTISARGSCLPDSGKRSKQIQHFAREGQRRKPSAWRDCWNTIMICGSSHAGTSGYRAYCTACGEDFRRLRTFDP